MNLFVNTILEWRDENFKVINIERVLWVEPDQRRAVVINIRSYKNMPEIRDYAELEAALETPYVKKLEIDPYSNFVNPSSNLLQKHGERRDKSWELIASLVNQEPDIYDSKIRGVLVKELSSTTGRHKKEIYRLLKLYWVRGKMKNALLPQFYKCGKPGKPKRSTKGIKLGRPPKAILVEPKAIGRNINENDIKNIKTAVTSWYNKSNKHPWTFAYNEMKRNLYNIGYFEQDGIPIPILPPDECMPSYHQFRYWSHKDLDIKQSLLKRIGERAYELTKRPRLGNATKRASGPGAIFEIDAAIAKAFLVSSFDRNRIIGRPVVYIAKDVFSRLVCGMYVGLEGPNWIGAAMCLENCTTDKVEFCKQYGISINESVWPCHYLPWSIVGDRGELESHNADYLPQTLGVNVQNTPPYRADRKPIVERHFGIIQGKIARWIPGAIRKEILERGDRDYRLDARLDITAFTRCIIWSILEHNQKELSRYPLSKDMAIAGVPPIPLEIWHWGTVNSSGWLQERPKEMVRLALMPHDPASVTRDGIYFQKRHYTCDIALQDGWYDRAGQKGRFSIEVAYDPRNVNYIYIPKKDGTGSFECQLLDQYVRFRDCRAEEVEDQLFEESVASQRRKTDQGQVVATSSTMTKDIVDKDKALTEKAIDPNQSKASRTKSIKTNRKEEKELIREKEKWGKVDVAIDQDISETPGISNNRAIEPLPVQTEINPLLKMLKKQQEERME